MEKRRSANWESTEELDITENPKIAYNTNVRKRQAWNIVHTMFNEVSNHNRTLIQIEKNWRKIKSMAKINKSAISDTEIEDLPANYVIVQNEPVTTDDEIINTEDDTPIMDRNKTINTKRIKHGKCQCDLETESSKRLKLLDLSIKHKELEMKYLEVNHNIQNRRNELLVMQKKVEHSLRVDKLKLELLRVSPNSNEI